MAATFLDFFVEAVKQLSGQTSFSLEMNTARSMSLLVTESGGESLATLVKSDPSHAAHLISSWSSICSALSGVMSTLGLGPNLIVSLFYLEKWLE